METQKKLNKIYALIIIATLILFLLSVTGLFFKARKMEARAKEVSEIITEDKPQVLGAGEVLNNGEILTAIRMYYIGEFKITAYCPCEQCCGKWAKNRPVDKNGSEIIYTASGQIAKANKTVGVDPKVIPYGTRLLISGNEYVAQDTGSALKGNIIDIYFETHQEAQDFGAVYESVYIIEEE